MLKKIILVLGSVGVLMASTFNLNETKSEVYYEAKKDQFFSTYTIIGINKGLSGSLVKYEDGYKGSLTVDAFSFITDSERRDSNVKEHLNSDKYKFITFEYVLDKNIVKGTIHINGVSKKISFPVVVKEDKSELLVSGKITIKYSDFNIETPSNLILTAHDDLVIGAKLYFNK